MTYQPTGIDTLRAAVNLFNGCQEGFNQQFTHGELMMLYKAYKASGWTITPDQWETRQVREALIGITPRFDDNEKAVYK